MKFRISLFTIVSLFVLSIFGCENEENNLNEDNSLYESKNLDNIGIDHNYYVKSYLDETNKVFDNTSDLLYDYYSFSIRNNPELKGYEELLMNHSNEFDINTNLIDVYDYIKDELDLMKSENKISDYLYSNFMQILNNPTLKNANEHILSMQNNGNLSHEERQRINSFVEVLNASETFWMNNYITPKNDDCDGIDHTEAVIISDAVGGALWWWTGPAAALISGGYSLAAHNGVGDCID